MNRILVVDDDAAACAAASGLLEALECAVEIVPDGGSAFKRLLRGAPDAVLVGLNIAAMDGGAFVRMCHDDPRLADVPVVVMAVTPRAAITAIQMGARGCIRKPVDAAGVMAVLQPLLWERKGAAVNRRGK